MIFYIINCIAKLGPVAKLGTSAEQGMCQGASAEQGARQEPRNTTRTKWPQREAKARVSRKPHKWINTVDGINEAMPGPTTTTILVTFILKFLGKPIFTYFWGFLG